MSRLRRASLFWPVFVVAEPLGRLGGAKHEVAALFHRAQASDLATGTGLASTGGGGRVATVGAVLGLCLGGASVGTVCVVTGAVPDLGGAKPARVEAKDDAPRRKERPREAPAAHREPPVVTKPALLASSETERRPTQSGKPKASTARSRRKAAAKEAAPREFGFENQAASGGQAEPSATTAASTDAPPQPTPARSAPKKFSPAEQEFAP